VIFSRMRGGKAGAARMSAATRNCPKTVTKLPAGGHESCPLVAMGSA
jgi:hypothetical protein